MSTPTAAPSRRGLLGGAAGSALGTAALAGPASAAAATRYVPARYRGARLLSAADRHLVNRFSYGLTPALATEVRRAGGARRWFERQLSPSTIPDAAGEQLVTWWSGLSREPLEIWQRQVQEIEGSWEVMEDYARWCLMRRIESKRQVLEVMTELWENHLAVPVSGDAQAMHRTAYGRSIRERALSSFEELLTTAITHPAMLVFLDGAVSTARHPNENLGRELLELHTVGRGNFTEDDVKASARILTGWRVDLWRTWAPSYSQKDHWVGPVSVLGFSDPNSSSDGQALTRRYLGYLARHPLTARRIARKLAVKFVSDDPPEGLVDELARVYLANGTQIRPVLRALVSSEAFRRSAGAKVRDPGEDLVATYRVMRVKMSRPDGTDQSGADMMLWLTGSMGTTPFAWPRPDGQPIDNDSWSSPSRLVASMDFHFSTAGGWWPKVGTGYRPHRAWLPRRSIRFDKLVDHLAQQLLGRRSTATLLRACCEAVDLRPGDVVDAEHDLVRWNFHRLLATFLDSPAHLTR